MNIEYDDTYGYGLYDSYSSLPAFNIEGTYVEGEFYANNKERVAQLIYEAALKLIGNDYLEIPVFRLHFANGKRATVSLHRNNFNESLEGCLRMFEELEQYEKCARVIKLLNAD